MPTISIKKKLLDKHLFNCYSFEELDEIFFSFGLEIDSIVIFNYKIITIFINKLFYFI